MRIGMMVDVYKPHVSGITTYISLHKRSLEKDGQEVFIFTFGDENYDDGEGNVIRSPGLPLLETGYYISFRYKALARKLLRNMDVVHIHHPFLSGSLALRFCRARGIPVVFTNHTRYDLYARAYVPILPDVVGETAMQAYMPSFCRACDLVIAPSPGLRDVLVRLGVDSPIDVVPNGIDLAPFREQIQPLEKARFGIRQEDVLLVYTGRLGPEKNLQFLLRSFVGVARAYDNVSLMLVGDGPERENLQGYLRESGVASRVCFIGMVPYEEMPGYLAMADAFVTASVTEVLPLTVIEAMATGLSVLGIQSTGIGDIVEDGRTGLLVEEEDMAAFTAKMVRMITDGGLRREMGKRASLAADKYAIDRSTGLLLERYQAVIERTRGRKSSLRARMNRAIDSWAR